jgi:hypothetical protein
MLEYIWYDLGYVNGTFTVTDSVPSQVGKHQVRTVPIRNKHRSENLPIKPELFIYRSIQRGSLQSTQVLVQIQIQNICEHLKMRQSSPELNVRKPLHMYHYNNQKHPNHPKTADMSILRRSQHQLFQFGERYCLSVPGNRLS